LDQPEKIVTRAAMIGILDLGRAGLGLKMQPSAARAAIGNRVPARTRHFGKIERRRTAPAHQMIIFDRPGLFLANGRRFEAKLSHRRPADYMFG